MAIENFPNITPLRFETDEQPDERGNQKSGEEIGEEGTVPEENSEKWDPLQRAFSTSK